MKPRELIGTAKVPGGVELRLVRHGDDHVIMVDNNELMSSRVGGSEEALATMTCDRLRNASTSHLLIGGYGMGFTLRAALTRLGPSGRATVAEIVPEIITWARGPMAALTAGCLDDPRVDLHAGDVAVAIKSASKRYDAILLDVDNGPSGLVRADNDGLYSMKGLAAATRRAEARRHSRDLVCRRRRRLHAPPEGCRVQGRGSHRPRTQQRQRAAPHDLVCGIALIAKALRFLPADGRCVKREGSAVMAQAAASSRKPRPAAGSRFYIAMGVVGLFAALTGFATTFFMPVAAGTFHAPLVVYLHGACAFAWVIIFAIQPWLIRRRNFGQHKQLGYAGLGVAIGFAMTAMPVAAFATARDVASGGGFETAVSTMVGTFNARAHLPRPRNRRPVDDTALFSVAAQATDAACDDRGRCGRPVSLSPLSFTWHSRSRSYLRDRRARTA